jgi:hypothetical protein
MNPTACDRGAEPYDADMREGAKGAAGDSRSGRRAGVSTRAQLALAPDEDQAPTRQVLTGLLSLQCERFAAASDASASPQRQRALLSVALVQALIAKSA